MIFPVLPTVRPEFLKPELMATECYKKEIRHLMTQRSVYFLKKILHNNTMLEKMTPCERLMRSFDVGGILPDSELITDLTQIEVHFSTL